MGKIDVTVIVPVFNGERFILDLINSLKKQTYAKSEFIIVDDGSTDNTQSIVLKEIANDSRFKIYIQENKGVSAARNLGLTHSKGQFVTFVDVDDYVTPDYVELLVQGINRHGISLAVTNIKGDHIEFSKDKVINGEAYVTLYTKFKGYACGKLFVNSVIKNNNLKFDTNFKIGEDLKFVFDYALIFKGDFQIAFIDEDAYSYQRRNDSATNQNSFLAYHDLSVVNNYVLEKTNNLNIPILKEKIIGNFLYFYYKQRGLAPFKADAFNVSKKILKNRAKFLNCKKTQRIKIFLWQHFPVVCRYISLARG